MWLVSFGLIIKREKKYISLIPAEAEQQIAARIKQINQLVYNLTITFTSQKANFRSEYYAFSELTARLACFRS
jgi:hypothetical protein